MPDRRTTERRIRTAARHRLGHAELQPGQAEAMRSVVEGHDTLAVMPTGAGKSAIYQVAGALIEGPTIVVSPLIALQRDQAEAIEEAEVGEARHLNSSLSERQRERVLDELAAGELEFLLLAPEQLVRGETLERVRAAGPSLFVVDEAHCVSDWGHDFRPEYLQLAAAAEAVGRPRILALTATASPPVRDEIAARLGMREPRVIVRGFDRPNIDLTVDRFDDEGAKHRSIVELVRESPNPGIVYTATRRRADELAALLREAGVDAVAYHAGLAARERDAAQTAFMEGTSDVVVATTAFGMGVDKPDVRLVVHADVPDSVDAYYQEIGRGGRDGAPAQARLFFRPQDLGLRRFFAATGQVSADEVRRVAEAVRAHGGEPTVAELREEIGLSQTKLGTALARLADADLIDLRPDGHVGPTRALGSRGRLVRAAQAAADADERHRAFERSRVEMMRGYAETRGCRRRYILNYFGEDAPPHCDRCDNCRAGRSAQPGIAADDLPVSADVEHRRFGSGQVVRHEGDRVVILFEQAGYKTLRARSALERGLLTAAGPGDR